MISCNFFYRALQDNGVRYFTGVPDSLLKQICAFITAEVADDRHIIAANEGNAVALATGHYMATGELPLVYLQNSGMGNITNPLISLADPSVYAIPMLFLIGWRGEPGKKDEPQHRKQGAITCELLEAMGVPHRVLTDHPDDAANTVKESCSLAMRQSRPVALVVRKGTFEPFSYEEEPAIQPPMRREDAVVALASSTEQTSVMVATTGKTARELYEYRARHGQNTGQDFLTVGSMGHASQIALAIAMAKPNKTIFCIDGDGALLMHMGGMAIIGSRKPTNFIHVVLNNGAHDSVGGQPTVGFDIDLLAIAKGCGYATVMRVETQQALIRAITELQASENRSGAVFLEVRIRRGARADLGRPTSTPVENKENFMAFLQG